MKERRLYKRHAVRLPSKIEAVIPSGKKKFYNLETKDISIGGAFIYTKEWYSFPEGTQFILDITVPSDSNKELKTVKNLMTKLSFETKVKSYNKRIKRLEKFIAGLERGFAALLGTSAR